MRFIEWLDVVFFQGCNSDHKNSHGCSLYAMNPRHSRGICLESFALPERSVSIYKTLMYCELLCYGVNFRSCIKIMLWSKRYVYVLSVVVLTVDSKKEKRFGNCSIKVNRWVLSGLKWICRQPCDLISFKIVVKWPVFKVINNYAF